MSLNLFLRKLRTLDRRSDVTNTDMIHLYSPETGKDHYVLLSDLISDGGYPDWQSGTTYPLNATVTYGFRLWKSLQAGNTAHVPNEDTWWTEVSATAPTSGSGIVLATASGTNTYTVALTPPLTTYADPKAFFIEFTNGNTGPVTLNIDGLGAKSIKKNSVDNLAPSDIIPGQILQLVYDGTNFQTLGVTKFVETQVAAFTQDSVTLSIYKMANFGTP